MKNQYQLIISQLFIIEMFAYSTASKSKNYSNAKMPVEILHHLKNSSDVGKRKHKENQNPRDLSSHLDIKIEVKNVTKVEDVQPNKNNRPKVVEDDISKIASSYILEGNVLKKHEAYEDAMRQSKKVGRKDKENMDSFKKPLDRKEVLKLEYLEKMGLLRPEEKQFLAEHRKTGSNEASMQATARKTSALETPAEKMADMGSIYLQTPKHYDQRQLTHLFSSNGKYMMPGIRYY